MNLFSKKTTLIKSGIAVMAIAIAGLNISQSNTNRNIASIVKISDAKASSASLICPSAPSKTCTGTTEDGVYHTISNAEN